MAKFYVKLNYCIKIKTAKKYNQINLHVQCISIY